MFPNQPMYGATRVHEECSLLINLEVLGVHEERSLTTYLDATRVHEKCSLSINLEVVWNEGRTLTTYFGRT